MRLCESPEFRDAIVTAKEYFNRPGLTEQFIEKDYYVTEALRIIATRWQNNIVFKGGTSLSKGWNLIQRFSEDLDLFLNRDTYQPKLSKNQVTKELRSIQTAVLDYPELILSRAGRSEVGVSRTSYFNYSAIFPGLGNTADRIMLEMGTRSGNYPITTIQLSSYLAEFLNDSQALFSTGELQQLIIREYQQQCRNLCYAEYPTWAEVADTFDRIRDKL
jgi:hypothetical protein